MVPTALLPISVSICTVARAVAWLSGEPLPFVGKSNASPSIPILLTNVCRSTASASAIVRWP
jgi:hypothetical protein